MAQMVSYSDHVESDEPLDGQLLELVEEVAREIERDCGVPLRFSYRRLYGFNVFGSDNTDVANFDLDGDYSVYDAWEYGEEAEQKIYDGIRRISASLSEDGKPHAR